jgi:limonene-1,2-epoxide hydrolase
MSETAATHGETDAGHGDPAAVVREFLRALEDLDVDRGLALVGPEILYHNKGLPPARGLAAFERQLRALARYATAFEARVHNLAAEGPIVLTERTDVIEIGRFRSEFWVCGTFEVRDGRIVVWRDYFDFVNVTWASACGLARALLGKRSPGAIGPGRSGSLEA